MKRFYRSRTDRMLGGVCGGLARYFDIDPTLVRVIFVLLILTPGFGLLLYLLLWIIMPYENEGEAVSAETIRSGAGEIAERAREIGDRLRRETDGSGTRTGLIVGVVLIGLGALFLLRSLNFLWLDWLGIGTLWPLLLVALGIILLIQRTKGD